MIIDQNSRLFKKINVIDFIAILVIVFAIGGMSFKVASKYIKTKGVQAGNTKTEYIKVKVSDVLPEVADQVKQRERLCDEDKLDAWIVKVKNTPALYTIQSTENGDVFRKENPYKRDLVITVKAKIFKDSDVPYTKIGLQTANVGSNFEIKTKCIDVRGVVISIR